MRRIAYLSLVLLVPCLAKADPILINFETVPVEATGPSVFSGGAPSQTIVDPGVATITGGVILGNETNLPAQSFATAPNVYATAGFDSLLSSTLTITIDPAFTATEVSFPILNGSTQAESYVVDAFNGATLVASQTFTGVPSNGSSGFKIADVLAPSITSVTVAPVALDAGCCNGWDYSIDSVALNQTVQQGVGGTVPEPASIELLGLGAAAAVAACRKRLLQRS